jgi:hypothetical protein
MKINITYNFTTIVTGHGNIKSYLHRFKILTIISIKENGLTRLCVCVGTYLVETVMECAGGRVDSRSVRRVGCSLLSTVL